jgi:hypothetical protein
LGHLKSKNKPEIVYSSYSFGNTEVTNFLSSFNLCYSNIGVCPFLLKYTCSQPHQTWVYDWIWWHFVSIMKRNSFQLFISNASSYWFIEDNNRLLLIDWRFSSIVWRVPLVVWSSYICKFNASKFLSLIESIIHASFTAYWGEAHTNM